MKDFFKTNKAKETQAALNHLAKTTTDAHEIVTELQRLHPDKEAKHLLPLLKNMASNPNLTDQDLCTAMQECGVKPEQILKTAQKLKPSPENDKIAGACGFYMQAYETQQREEISTQRDAVIDSNKNDDFLKSQQDERSLDKLMTNFKEALFANMKSPYAHIAAKWGSGMAHAYEAMHPAQYDKEKMLGNAAAYGNFKLFYDQAYKFTDAEWPEFITNKDKATKLLQTVIDGGNKEILDFVVKELNNHLDLKPDLVKETLQHINKTGQFQLLEQGINSGWLHLNNIMPIKS